MFDRLNFKLKSKKFKIVSFKYNYDDLITYIVTCLKSTFSIFANEQLKFLNWSCIDVNT